MLSELFIRQFGLIEEARLQLTDGMTLFSGETGAGKSMIVDALGSIFGGRADKSAVRFGAEQAEISAVLESDAAAPWQPVLDEYGIEADEALHLRRVIAASGRSRSWINGSPVPLKALEQIGDLCLDLHGQHEHQSLMRPGFARDLLDGQLPSELLTQVAALYAEYRQAEAALATLKQEQAQSAMQEQWLRAESRRLDLIAPHLGLLEELTHQVEAGRHHAQIQVALQTALTLLDDGEPASALLLARALRALEAASQWQPQLETVVEPLRQADALLADALASLRRMQDQSFDPATMQAAEERLFELREALRRHGQEDEAGLATVAQSLREKISRLETAGWDEQALANRLNLLTSRYREVSANVSHARREAADKLTAALRPWLDRLALAGMQVRITLMPRSDGHFSPTGGDEVLLEAASNPGEPFYELRKSASGGELSRFALALKGCGAISRTAPVAVFDEVDVGIGGETAWSVGELLRDMAVGRQVLVVSHLPQVAACADQQIRIEKLEQEGRTITRLSQLDLKSRHQELARMLGFGQELEHAEALLARGRRKQ